MKKILIALCMLILNFYGLGFAQTTAAEIQRSQEILQEDRALRQKISEEEKFFVKTIIVKGALKLSEEETKGIIAPFQGRWMTTEDIRQLIDLLKSAYAEKGIKASQLKVSHKLKKDKTLEITVDELTK
jgi:hemolysin activation/secretion protein